MDTKSPEILQFIDVSFGYEDSKTILKKVNFQLLQGKTYALVGPTGGGKSTTASLMVRLYDPTSGIVEFKNRDIRSYTPDELSQSIGFILQEPFLFTGTVADNIRYGNSEIEQVSDEELGNMLSKQGLDKLMSRFSEGLETKVSDSASTISLGQKQLIAFMRILLRQPQLLIMDEATANIDTITEQLLTEIISKLPTTTTKVIIAHRLNTIQDADSILFINGGHIQPALDFDDALKLIDTSRRTS